ncbi:protein MIGRI [Chitinibacter fontanus]|uniref:protein MIGRI n=1 Tax=Chitinibacter fontanus TaxID=1737446 RepID=UPI00402B25F5
MNGKINLFILLLLAAVITWQWLGPHRRKEIHRTVHIAAGVLLTVALLAIVWHQYSG